MGYENLKIPDETNIYVKLKVKKWISNLFN